MHLIENLRFVMVVSCLFLWNVIHLFFYIISCHFSGHDIVHHCHGGVECLVLGNRNLSASVEIASDQWNLFLVIKMLICSENDHLVLGFFNLF